jgi:chemotaxis protein MotB
VGRKQKHPEHVNHERWLVSYADFITLLVATFTALYALSKSDADTAKAVADGMREAFGSGTPQMITMESPEADGIPSRKHKAGPKKSDQPGKSKPSKKAGKEEFEKIKDELESYLMTKGALTKVSIDIQERGLRVSMKEGGFFESGKADVKTDAYSILGELAEKVNKFGNQLRVEGHTDNVPMRSRTFPSNWELSSARATNVARVLTEKFGVPAEKISATGYGEHRPVFPNTDVAGRSRNRRVDLVVLSSGSDGAEPKVLETRSFSDGGSSVIGGGSPSADPADAPPPEGRSPSGSDH